MRRKQIFTMLFIILFLINAAGFAQETQHPFRQLGTLLPAPNAFRSASGAPGPEYWQQRADYDITVKLDENAKRIDGRETITYYNHSPEPLDFVWIQLDQNLLAKNSLALQTRSQTLSERMRMSRISNLHRTFDGGFRIESVVDKDGKALEYEIVQTMMRLDLNKTLRPGRSCTIRIKYGYLINNKDLFGGRSGYLESEEDSSLIFAIAQFYPRMAVYDDVKGWRHKQYLGSGEFALPFGNYKVSITVPADHIIGATGTLQNPARVLSLNQRKQLEKAWKTPDRTVLIVDEAAAVKNMKSKSDRQKTWIFKAENVRDFAFVSSRNFIWDAMAVPLKSHTVLAMSYYTREGNPLWEKFSTKALAHAVRFYSKYTVEYPYSKAISAMVGRGGGMEYPMIAFNGGRPDADGSYPEWAKKGLVGVIIHEFGHNIFPMVVNSDERQWGWMDEGMNSFVEYLAEEEWSRTFNSRNGPAYTAVRDPRYTRFSNVPENPIMTACDIDPEYGYNAYTKTPAGLTILRETVMGRKLFDFAFKTYAERWKFKHPTPADFFRTMEDASGMDLDWFWRGWFFSTDKVDLAIDRVTWYRIRQPGETVEDQRANNNITKIRNRTSIAETVVETDTTLLDKYDMAGYVGDEDKALEKFMRTLSDEDSALVAKGYNYYQIDIKNNDGMIMPVILKFEFQDRSEDILRIPVEIWRRDNTKVSKVYITEKTVKNVTLDPFYETADSNMNNNAWSVTGAPSFIELSTGGRNRSFY